MRKVFACLILSCVMYQASAQIQQKPRTIITTDGEVDDQDSFIRLLMYSNEFHIEGLVYSSSQWHYKGDGKGTQFISEMQNTAQRYGKRTELRWPGETWMQEFIDKYALVYDNLQKHDKAYPSPEYLQSIIKTGNINFEGEMSENTEGSEFIKKILLDEKPGPVYLQIWGGTNTVARALKSIEDEYKNSNRWQEIQKKVSGKAILYTVLDQDASYQKYVAPNWPDIRVMYNSYQFWSFAYLWPRVVPEELKTTLKGKWMKENIIDKHGPFTGLYFSWGDGKKIAGDPEHTHGDTAEARKLGLGQFDFISEGDSPAFLYLTDVGLRSMEDASWGGWGGRMIRSATNPNRWEDGKEVTDYNPYTKKDDRAYPQTRWITALQNDFAARADWCVKDHKNANHAPVVELTHAQDILAKPGETIQLGGRAKDPDGNTVSYKWWQYGEAGTYPGTITLENANSNKGSFIIPANAKPGETIHIILEVADNGTPQLARYRRVVITVR